MAATLRKPFNDNQHDVERRFAPRTIPDQVAEELGAEIVSGRRKAGERLVELDLARDFGVSRGPIREAIRILERRRLVDIFPRRANVSMKLSTGVVAMVRTASIDSAVRTLNRSATDLSDSGLI
jgi:DNA-binding FadR family transcriptional regulator